MLFNRPALQTAGPAPAAALVAKAAGARPGSALTTLAGAALFFLAAAAGLIAALGNPYDGAPVVRVRIAGAHAKPEAPKAAVAKPAPPAAPPLDPLSPAPFAGMTLPGPGGPLPIIAADGRESWKAYARPYHDDGKPKVALVIGGLGLDPAVVDQAITQLPPEITLAFTPYAENLQALIDKARAAGHEVMIEIPMEPSDYPENDPGPYTLTANAPVEEMGRKLDWLMARGAGYFGVVNVQGARFVAQGRSMSAFTQTLRQRGVAFIDDGQAAGRGDGLHRASAGVRIDADLDAPSIDRQLLMLEAQALQKGGAVGLGSAYPLTTSQVLHWVADVRNRGYALAPASAVMTLRP
jgi:polysaccharide deacetylase 2 family uncharacterized protein YibQ